MLCLERLDKVIPEVPSNLVFCDSMNLGTSVEAGSTVAKAGVQPHTGGMHMSFPYRCDYKGILEGIEEEL